jgi:hypothetical protein
VVLLTRLGVRSFICSPPWAGISPTIEFVRLELSVKRDDGRSSANDTRVLVLALPVVLRGRSDGLRLWVGVILPDVEVDCGDFGRRTGDPLGWVSVRVRLWRGSKPARSLDGVTGVCRIVELVGVRGLCRGPTAAGLGASTPGTSLR